MWGFTRSFERCARVPSRPAAVTGSWHRIVVADLGVRIVTLALAVSLSAPVAGQDRDASVNEPATVAPSPPRSSTESAARPRGQSLDIGGSWRLRPEARHDVGFDPQADQAYVLSRLRVRLTARLTDTLLAVAEMQDSRSPGLAASTPSLRDPADLHQGYLDIGAVDGVVRVRVGRQEMPYGAERILSRNDWRNTGRSFDAVRLFFQRRRGGLDLFGAAEVRREPAGFNPFREQGDLYGAYGYSFTGSARAVISLKGQGSWTRDRGSCSTACEPRVSRPGAQDGGPTPSPRAGVLPAPGVARHARPGRRHVRQAPRPQPQAGRGPPRRHAQGATPGRRPDRSPLPPTRCGAARSRRRRRRAAGPAAVNRAGDAAARGPVRPGELDAGRPQGPLRADGRAARRAEPVRRAISEQDEVRRRAGRGGVADAVGAAGLPRTPRGGTPRRSAPCAARLRPGGAAAAHPP